MSRPADGWFTAKATIVTGASPGIGRAVVDRIAAQGTLVFMNARDQEALDVAPRMSSRPAGRRWESAAATGGVVQPAPAPRFSSTPAALSRPSVPPGTDTERALAD